MDISPKIIKVLNDQIKLELSAWYLGFGLCLYAKTEDGMEGAHKWLGEFWEEELRRAKGISKLLLNYCDQPVTLPSMPECPCKSANYITIWEEILRVVEMSQKGFDVIADMADSTNCQEINEFCDPYLHDNRQMVKKLNRLIRTLKRGPNDQAFLYHFDRVRLKKIMG